MRHHLFTMATVAVLMGTLVTPHLTYAQTLAESVSKLSGSEVQQILKEMPAPPRQSTATPSRNSSRSKVLGWAVIGALSGGSAGMLINRTCAGERSSGCLTLPIGLGAAGAAIGAIIGSNR